MQAFLDSLLNVVVKVNGFLTDYILIVLLVGVGLFYTIKTRFVQVRCFGEGMKKVFGNIKLRGGKQEGGISSFQALATAIAAQVGTGNIVGASGAILVGGPGAIFWMWIIAFFGMATIYAEATLAQETRYVDENGEVHGGPVYYIKAAFKGAFGKFLAVFFSIATVLALGFMGTMVQSNSIAESVTNATGIAGWVVGLVVAVIAAFIFIGGIQRIASVTEKMVPIMACLFLLGGLVILAFNFKAIPETFGMIFKYAFTPKALIGGAAGAAIKAAISQGAKRGLFSNEAGMGSTPHAHAMAKVEKPHDQGVVAMIGVFIDTFVVLTMTALVIISTMYTGNGKLATAKEYINSADFDKVQYEESIAKANEDKTAEEIQEIVDKVYADADAGHINADVANLVGVSKTNAMQTAAGSVFGTNFGSIFVAVCLFFFAFSTILSWNFFGKLNVESLFNNKKWATVTYSVIAIVFIFLGSCLKNDLVWELTDFFNYLMVLPNVIALFALSKLVTKNSNNKK